MVLDRVVLVVQMQAQLRQHPSKGQRSLLGQVKIGNVFSITSSLQCHVYDRPRHVKQKWNQAMECLHRWDLEACQPTSSCLSSLSRMLHASAKARSAALCSSSSRRLLSSCSPRLLPFPHDFFVNAWQESFEYTYGNSVVICQNTDITFGMASQRVPHLLSEKDIKIPSSAKFSLTLSSAASC